METIIFENPTDKKKKTINAKFVYSFHEGDGKNKQLLGGKGANQAIACARLNRHHNEKKSDNKNKNESIKV